MRLCLLHLDDALDGQTQFVEGCRDAGALQVQLRQEGKAVRLWGYHDELASISKTISGALSSTAERQLAFIGSGDFHHISASLLAAALANTSADVTLVHFDNHPDWVEFAKGTHCGSWINRALEHPRVKKVITVGVCSNDLEQPEPKLANLSLLSKGLLELYPYEHAPSRVSGRYGDGASFEQKDGHLHWKSIRAIGEQQFPDYLISRIATEAVYLTIDKDVLSTEEAVTNWDQGVMRLPYLLSMVRKIGAGRQIIGADVIGDYSPPSYSGGPRKRLSKYYEVLKDQPRSRPSKERAAQINGATNSALLGALSEAMS